MKKNIIFLYILLFNINLFSQTKISSDYEFKYYATINTHILEEYHAYLYFDNVNSVFYWEMFGDNSIQYLSENHMTAAEHLKHGEFNYLNRIENNIIFKGIVSKSEFHLVKQANIDFGWKLQEESQIIAGYTCFKATANYMGRNYTAWFTREIPFPYGPWKLNGLPGLILKAYDETQEIAFSIIEIKKKEQTKELDLTNQSFISLKDYYQRVIDYPFEKVRIAQSKASRGSTITITSVNWNFLEKDFESLEVSR
jgi:GLPGLI family protein